MSKNKDDFRDKAKRYKGYVTKKEISTLFKEMKKDSAQDLSRIIADQTIDRNNNQYVARLIDFINAELFDRKLKHSRWSTWVIAGATVVIAASTVINVNGQVKMNQMVEVGAVCVSSARTDLYGGCRVTDIPTVTL